MTADEKEGAWRSSDKNKLEGSCDGRGVCKSLLTLNYGRRLAWWWWLVFWELGMAAYRRLCLLLPQKPGTFLR